MKKIRFFEEIFLDFNGFKKIQDKLFKNKMKYCTRSKRERTVSR